MAEREHKPGRANVEVGETFTVSDGHHLFTHYTLIGIADGAAMIDIQDQSVFPGFENASPKKRATGFHDYRPITTESPNQPKQ
jgi:hypothetical protein